MQFFKELLANPVMSNLGKFFAFSMNTVILDVVNKLPNIHQVFAENNENNFEIFSLMTHEYNSIIVMFIRP